MRPTLTRRALALGGTAAAAAGVSGCSGIRELPLVGALLGTTRRDGGAPVRTPDYAAIYGRVTREPYPVPAFDYTSMDPGLLRAEVGYLGPEPPGTVVVDAHRRSLFLVGKGGRATRYGVAIGREMGGWSGSARIGARQSWPETAPGGTTAAVARPRASRATRAHPFGARALVLMGGSGDTGLRIHGATDPYAIGTELPAGAIGMIDQDVIHLAARVSEGTPVVVLP